MKMFLWRISSTKQSFRTAFVFFAAVALFIFTVKKTACGERNSTTSETSSQQVFDSQSVAGKESESNSKSALRVFNIRDAVFYGLKNNQQMLIALEDIEIARAKIRETNALIFPKIDFNLHAAQYESLAPFTLSDSLGSAYYEARPFRSENYTARFMLSQYIYAGGKYTSNMRLARTNLLIAETTKDILAAKVRADIKKAFYELLYARTRDELLRSEIKRLSDLLPSEGRQPAGNKSGSDEIQGMLSELRRLSYSSESNLAAAQLKFLSAMGLELNTQFDIDGDLEIEFKDYDVDKLIAQAYQFRSELNKVAIQETIDSLSVSLLQAERFPSIMMGGLYEFADANRSDNKKNWAMFVNLNLPVFDGWASWARLDIKKSQARQNSIRRVDAEDSIAGEVRLAFIAYESSRKKVKYDEETLAKIKSAVSDKTPLSDGIYNKIFRARLNLLESRLEAALALVNLEKAVGKELP